MATARGERLPELDGLRGLAILCVMFHHFGFYPPQWMDWGPVAPSVFFLLSGYLITGSLTRIQRSWESAERKSFADVLSFHLRRLVRLMPAFYVLLAVGWLAGMREFREEFPWHAAFLTNWQMALYDHWPDRLSHLWSLSIQEQFYIFWPVILFLPARMLPWALVTTFLSAALFRAWCVHAGVSDMFRWFMLPSSLDNFAAGGLVAWAVSRNKVAPLLTPLGKWMGGMLALACWLVSRELRDLNGTDNLALAFVETLESVLFAWLLLMLLQSRKGVFARGFAWRPLVYVGRISYGLYLWHVLVFCALVPVLANWGITFTEHPLALGSFITLACILVASLSWKLLEEPFIVWSQRVRIPENLWANWRIHFSRWLRRTSVE